MSVEMNAEGNSVSIHIASELAEKVNSEDMKSCLQKLVRIFKENYVKIFPTEYRHEYDLLEACCISDSLHAFRDFSGYDKLVSEFSNNKEHASLILFLANFLAGTATGLEFEPSTGHRNYVGDLKASISGQDVLFECKAPKANLYQNSLFEQRNAFSVLSGSLRFKGDLFIAYSGDMLKNRLDELLQFLNDKLPLVSGAGTILHERDITVSVTRTHDAAVDVGDFEIGLPPFQNTSEENNQINIFRRGGLGVGFCKMDVDSKRNLKTQLKNSRYKVDGAHAYVLVVHSGHLPGRINDLANYISVSFFNETKNTRLSGVLLLSWKLGFGKHLSYQTRYINNPFAKNPVGGLATLFG